MAIGAIIGRWIDQKMSTENLILHCYLLLFSLLQQWCGSMWTFKRQDQNEQDKVFSLFVSLCNLFLVDRKCNVYHPGKVQILFKYPERFFYVFRDSCL
ncbi:MAG: hypothetical protein IPP06_08935 [Saprospiraceae bacterium]|nr:hypothetical protein [Candidatus Vicinibacter affinis]